MERVVLAGVLVVLAALLAAVLSRRRSDPPTQARVSIPRQVDRADFARPEAPWLVAVFTSEACGSCQRAIERARPLESATVAYDEIPWPKGKDVHQRYRIDDVPLIIVADARGVVQRSFVGTPSLADLAAALAEARDPGSTPDPGVGRLHDD